MRQILLMIGLVALVGCGEKEPSQPTMPKSEITKSEPTKAKATAGVKLWEFITESAVFSSPVIGPDSTLYVGSRDNNLYAINSKSGAKLWEFETEDMAWSSPTIGPDGTIYISSYDKKIMPSKRIPQAPPKARGRCLGRMPNALGVQSRLTSYSSLVSPNNPPCVRT